MNFVSSFDDRRLLVTDLDGTLIGGSKKGRQKLQTALEEIRETITMVYVSGQGPSEQVNTIQEHQLLLPDYMISAVGTEIHRLPGEYPLDEWYRYIQDNFSHEAIVDFLAENIPTWNCNPPKTRPISKPATIGKMPPTKPSTNFTWPCSKPDCRQNWFTRAAFTWTSFPNGPALDRR